MTPKAARRAGRLSGVARSTLSEFLHAEATGGVVLVVAALIALVWANSGARDSYESLWASHLTIGIGRFALRENLHRWVNDALMALFFFVVGVEVKRELVVGELRDRRAATLPVVAALGGMVLPAAIFAAWNLNSSASHGWGIPMATDIAFAVGVLALLGSRIPQSLKVFLLALAIVDDIGAILVIAIFYSRSISFAGLAVSAGLIGCLVPLWRIGVRTVWIYVVVGVGLWIAVHASGVHATIAGVVLGLLLPTHVLTNRRGRTLPPAERIEHVLHPVTSFVVIPVFALANAGVRIQANAFDRPGTLRVALGVVTGLVVGKVVGITAASWIVVRCGRAVLPEGVMWRQLVGVAILGGVGFTVSLFVNELAFVSAPLREAAKIGIVVASLVSAGVGATVLLVVTPRSARANTTAQ